MRKDFEESIPTTPHWGIDSMYIARHRLNINPLQYKAILYISNWPEVPTIQRYSWHGMNKLDFSWRQRKNWLNQSKNLWDYIWHKHAFMCLEWAPLQMISAFRGCSSPSRSTSQPSLSGHDSVCGDLKVPSKATHEELFTKSVL